jgi:hypothetical protein
MIYFSLSCLDISAFNRHIESNIILEMKWLRIKAHGAKALKNPEAGKVLGGLMAAGQTEAARNPVIARRIWKM